MNYLKFEAGDIAIVFALSYFIMAIIAIVDSRDAIHSCLSRPSNRQLMIGILTYSFVETSIVYKVYSPQLLQNLIKFQLCVDMFCHWQGDQEMQSSHMIRFLSGT